MALLEAWQRGRGLYRWLGLTLEAHPKCNLDADNILSADFPSQIDFHLGHKIESACVRCPPTRRCVAGDDVRMLWLKSQPIPGRMTETDGVGRQMVFSNLALSENSGKNHQILVVDHHDFQDAQLGVYPILLARVKFPKHVMRHVLSRCDPHYLLGGSYLQAK